MSEEAHKFSEMYDNLLGQGICQLIAKKLDEIHQSGVLRVDELDDRALEALKEFNEDDASNVLEQFCKSDLSHVQNKSAFLCGVMKTYRAKMKNKDSIPTPSVGAGVTKSEVAEIKQGPHEEKVKQLLDRTGYTLDITTGQRKYGGPPPHWEGPVPGTGEKKFCSQIFIGKLPRDMYEDELVPMFEPHGTIYDLRIMVDPFSGLNKGFAFCTYTTKEAATLAVKEMDGKQVRDGKTLGVCLSQANNRLFVGSIPKSKTKQQIFDEFASKVENLSDVIVYISSEDKSKNRGFAFLEFTTHKDASLARRRFMTGRIKVFGNITPTVDWADPVEEPDDNVMSKVKVVYVRNLSPAIEETKLNELFKQYGAVEKVKKLKDYAFIHFVNRDDAVRAIEELNGQDLDDLKIEVSLAKPQTEKKEARRGQSGFGSLNQSEGGNVRGGGHGGMRGGYGNFPSGGYNNDYGFNNGGYGNYDDSSYDNYYGGPPPQPQRGGGALRGAPSRGGPRGGSFSSRGSPNVTRGMPRGGSRGGGSRGGGSRGGGGVPRGRGASFSRGAMASKRKMEGGYDQQQSAVPKRRFGNDQGSGGWNSQPIPQQPLKNEGNYYSDDYGGGGQQEWYQDSYGGQWK
ncbi:heterogeneous nuclear ribonucleoprotein Q isoform X1 [Hydra vulgaris]|uniref:heterogeneous nuclear ribonucleoprotein Q isoform X1 n=1 Tax=Hydra vulgaris TaxID=6087 RepID=UPI001F5FF126|nr:heterogeneous nuclear ribonucleoprotein Q [Hydra vulgaris]